MNKFLTIATSTTLLLGAFLITGCSSSDDGGTTTPTTTASVPANAILIDSSAVAEETVVNAVATGDIIVSAIPFGVETSTTLTGKDILNIAIDKVLNNNLGTSSLATGVAFSEPCAVSGTISGDETETTTTYSATVTFNACNDGSITLTGTIIINATFTATDDGPYTVNASGNLTATTSTISVGFNGFRFDQSGNDSTGDYTITTFTYAIDPSTGGGYLVELTQPLVGNEFVSCQLTSGVVLVTGAAGSQARGTVNPDRTVKVEYHSGDGNFIETDNSPLDCLLI